jgi:hypothetical protein
VCISSIGGHGPEALGGVAQVGCLDSLCQCWLLFDDLQKRLDAGSQPGRDIGRRQVMSLGQLGQISHERFLVGCMSPDQLGQLSDDSRCAHERFQQRLVDLLVWIIRRQHGSQSHLVTTLQGLLAWRPFNGLA